MHNLFLVYFVNLYRFRSRHQEVQLYVYNNRFLFFLGDCLLSWLESNQDNKQSPKMNNKY